MNLTDEDQKYIQKRPSRQGGYLYAEPILQQFQLWLMKNQANQGKSSQVVKQARKNYQKFVIVMLEHWNEL